ncbi:MAG: hypothetical protein V2I63_12170 [Pseudomonadales bacterium]|jgi:hypothetical protein|nr:hypothetical protein [Pseudomonadales bacterium]
MSYFWGWVVCLSATVVVIGCGLYLTRWIRPPLLRDLIRLLAIATLLVPVRTGVEVAYWAPAYIVFVFEAFLQRDGDPGPALAVLAAGWIGALVLLVAIVLLRRRRSGAPPDSP